MLDESLTQKLSAIAGLVADDAAAFSDLTTLRVGGKPQACLRAASSEAAVAAVRAIDSAGVPVVIVGGGSNLLVADGEVDAIALVLEFAAVRIEDSGLVRAEAGAHWDDVVARCVAAGLGGIECLSGIPGTAGAVPVQNVGAYGAEISRVLRRVRLYDRRAGREEWVPAQELELAYRYSNLKFTARAVVLEIELQLTTDGLSVPLRFGQLTDTAGERLPAAQVRENVLQLRRAKGMLLDPLDHDTWSAGSFFTNPVVDSAQAESIQEAVRRERGEEDAARMPRHPAGEGKEKLSAAWLIDRAGFAKGYPGTGPARLSTKHTLALTNRGAASAADIVALAEEIQGGVAKHFGVHLVPEPVWIGIAGARA